jgi:uncharacterized membrane protein YgdD (TMEM256/DUF423 family)
MNKQIIVTAAILGALAVVLGAFGAHGLRSRIDARQLEVWQTAVQYHFYHVFALLFLAVIARPDSNAAVWSWCFFFFGILLFSGSLYLISCRDIFGMPGLVKLGPVTPVGGLLFIAGWISLAIAAVKK